MFRWKHRSSRAVFKTVFYLLGIIFLISQVSYKFYTFSSQLVFARPAHITKPVLHPHDHRVLSLDKRYKAQRGLATLNPPLRFVLPMELGNRPFPVDVNPVVAGGGKVILLRGPPAIA